MGTKKNNYYKKGTLYILYHTHLHPSIAGKLLAFRHVKSAARAKEIVDKRYRGHESDQLAENIKSAWFWPKNGNQRISIK